MDELNTLTGKEIATLLVPSTVTLVTARDAAGRDRVATVAWVQPLSHEPSLIGVCLRPGGVTARAIAEGGCFTVSVLRAGDAKRALTCGKKGPDQPERFEAAQLTRTSARKVAACRVAEALSWIECELVEQRTFGDHDLYVGRTLVAQTAAPLGDDGRLLPAPALLMGQRGRFGHFEED